MEMVTIKSDTADFTHLYHSEHELGEVLVHIALDWQFQ